MKRVALFALFVFLASVLSARISDPQPSAVHPAKPTSTIRIRALLPNGQQAQRVYLTLWRALEPDEAGPVNHVNGRKGFGYYAPVVWEDTQHSARWIRVRSAHPNDGKHGWEEESFAFTDLVPGRYRITAVSYRPGDGRPDPTPYGVTEVISVGLTENGDLESQLINVDVRLGGIAPLRIRVIDSKSQQPIAGLAVRLRSADRMPIVHGHGSGNFFEWTGEAGEVDYGHLRPGDYTVQLLGKRARVNHFIQYEPISAWTKVHVRTNGPTNVDIPIPPRYLEDEEIERRFPFYVYGTVTNVQGHPLENVEVAAATGAGTLMGGGRTRTNTNGRYRLYLSPGITVLEDDAPLGVGTQAALISARKEGWYETDLNRSGSLAMSDQDPAVIANMLEKDGQVWGHTSIDRVVFPGVPRQVNFTLAKAALIRGRLLSNGSRELDDQQLYLTGDELPPGSSAFTSLETDDDGQFQIKSVPLGRRWRFGMRIAGTWDEIETQTFNLERPGEHTFEVSLDSERLANGAVALRLTYRTVEE